MESYDAYLARKADEYFADCEHYKDEQGQMDHCCSCPNFCEEYLETLDTKSLIEIVLELKEKLAGK